MNAVWTTLGACAAVVVAVVGYAAWRLYKWVSDEDDDDEDDVDYGYEDAEDPE